MHSKSATNSRHLGKHSCNQLNLPVTLILLQVIPKSPDPTIQKFMSKIQLFWTNCTTHVADLWESLLLPQLHFPVC